jgi:DNA/RNA-binding domain of Phe-tRNA-synthetase-like protein
VRFRIEEEIFRLFPGLRVVGAVVEGVENRDDGGRVAAEWEAAWAEAAGLAERYPNAQSHPHVAAWRESMKRIGVSPRDFPSSIEALLRRAMKGAPPPRINPLVDLLHSISLRFVVPVGGFDLAGIADGLGLRTTRPGDTFRALDADEPEPVEPGEVAYAAGSVVLTRHFVWRQARDGLVEPGSRHVFLVSEILPEVGAETAERVAGDLSSRVEDLFGAPVRPFALDAERASFEW